MVLYIFVVRVAVLWVEGCIFGYEFVGSLYYLVTCLVVFGFGMGLKD